MLVVVVDEDGVGIRGGDGEGGYRGIIGREWWVAGASRWVREVLGAVMTVW